jgi:hypothetical protein
MLTLSFVEIETHKRHWHSPYGSPICHFKLSSPLLLTYHILGAFNGQQSENFE